jgi:hypothetical protein
VLLVRGADVQTKDGAFGSLVGVVPDPLADEVTYLVMSPDGELVRVTAPSMEAADDVRFPSVLRGPLAADPNVRPCEMLSAQRAHMDEFELRHGSDVISVNDRDLGHVVGFLTADDLVHALIVRSGLLGFTHDVIVPLDAIVEVVGDMILLDIDRHQFRSLESTSDFADHHAVDRLHDLVRHAAARTWYAARDHVYAALTQR